MKENSVANILGKSILNKDTAVDIKKELKKFEIVVQKALDETQLLFDSLMQKYFG